MITCGTQIVSGAPVNGGGGSSAPSGTGIVSVTDGVYDMPGVTTADLAAAFAGLGLSAVLAGCSSYLAFTSLADTSVFTGGLTRAVGTLTGVDNQALGVPVGTRFAVSFSGGGAQAYGGIYIVTNAGSVSTQPVITRAAEFDSSADFAALSDAGWPCGDSGLLRLSTTGGTTLDTSPVEFDVALGAVALEALIAAAIPASTLTTRGDLLRRGASAAERVAIGAAGTRLRSDGTDPVWSEPDVVCTAAELATTYAPSVVLRGVIAYTTDTLSTYVCRRTAASTYAWLLIDYPQITEPTTQPLLRYKLDEAVGATTVVNSGSASSANLTLTGSAYAFGVATGLPYGLRCYPTASNYATGATAVQPAYPITVRAWLYCIGFTVAYAKVLYKAYNAAAWSAPEGNGLTFPAGLTGAIEGHITVGGTRRTVVCSGTGRYLIPGQWNLVALTYDGATMELSINGISVGTTAQAGAIDYGAGTARDWMLAGNYRVGGAAEPLDGMIAEACVDGSVIPLATLRQWYLRGVRRAS